MRWDAWHAEDIDLYATIGQLQKQAGIVSSLRNATSIAPWISEGERIRARDL